MGYPIPSSGTATAEILSRVTERELGFYRIPLEQIKAAAGDDPVKMFVWLDEVGYSVDVKALRESCPEIGWHTFEAWAKEQDRSVLDETA